jgi:sterol desaturase/sphingolipid hydroxylase (fatty acid hydroxylase superfamily)
MPPWLQMVYFVIYLPLATLVLAYFAPFQMIILMPFIFGLIMWYGIYELVHWTEHLPSSHALMRFKAFNWLRNHHVIHHSDLKDQVNFGIVEPSMDYLFRTKR